MGRLYTIYRMTTPIGIYVGATSRTLAQRKAGHLVDMKRYPVHPLYSVRASIAAEDLKMDALETCDESAWEEREMHWISQFRKLGPLLNKTDGGAGPNGLYVPESRKREHRRKMASRWETDREGMLARVNAHKTTESQSSAGKRGWRARMEKQPFFSIRSRLSGQEIARFQAKIYAARAIGISSHQLDRYLSGKKQHRTMDFVWLDHGGAST